MKNSHAKTQRRKDAKGIQALCALCASGVPLSSLRLCAVAVNEIRSCELKKATTTTPSNCSARVSPQTRTTRGPTSAAARLHRNRPLRGSRSNRQKVPPENTRHRPVRHELAETLAITGRYTEAIAEFERAAADSAKQTTSPTNSKATCAAPKLLDLIGQEDRAKTIYESFVKYYTDNDPQTARELTLDRTRPRPSRTLPGRERHVSLGDRSRLRLISKRNSAPPSCSQKNTPTATPRSFSTTRFKINPNSARAFLARRTQQTTRWRR